MKRLISKQVTVKTAHSWLIKLGFTYVERRKGIYVDGHERDDVVAHRLEFLDTQMALSRRADADHLIRYYHDEVAWNANDANR